MQPAYASPAGGTAAPVQGDSDGTQLAFMLAVILFALALISEQVSALRFDRSERER